MSRRSFRVLVLVVSATCAGSSALFIDGCGSDSGDVATGPTSDAPSGKEGGDEQTDASAAAKDGGADGSSTDAGADAGSCSKGKVRPATGETCVGYGKGSPCSAECGEYGYVCFQNGGPPGFAGCLLINDNGQFGQTYCCTENKCVAQPDEDGKCTTPGKTHRYQCPPDGNGGHVAPPAGCADGGAGDTALERFYCCP